MNAEAVITLLLLAIPFACLAWIAVNRSWRSAALHAVIPIAERRVTLPARPHSAGWTMKAVGYRGTEYHPPPRRDAVSLDPSRDRGPDVHVLPGNRALAVRILIGRRQLAFVRIEVAREGEDVVARSFACKPKDHHPDWSERLARTIEPLLDRVLYEVTGQIPVLVPPTRVAADIELAEERELERAIARASRRR